MTRTLDYTCQICNALDHAHQQGVIHRDLRPGNVLVTEGGLLKVADFGTSRFIELAAHGTTVIGSPPYMAPEQFHGKTVFASDIYSLGVTMYQMLTGVLPYNTPAPADLEKLMKGELVSPPRTRNPKIPAQINDIVMKAVAPDVKARYQRASDLLNDLLSARGRRKTPRALPGKRRRRRRLPCHLRRLCRIFTLACARAKHRSHASAGTAASHFTPDRRAARFVAKRSKC